MTTANTSRANSAVANTPIIPAPPPDVSQTINVPYSLAVHNAAGEHQSFLPDWANCTRRAAVNEPEVLKFTVPEGSIATASLVGFNEIWLHRGAFKTVPVQKYQILVPENDIRQTADLKIEAESFLGQLAREWIVTSYETTEDTTLVNIVGDILSAHQVQTLPISRGNIAAAIGNTIIPPVRFDNRSILSVLHELRAYAGGYFSVDTSRRLDWSVTTGTTEKHWIRLGHNATSIKKTPDFRALKNRVVGYGAGVDDATRLKSTKDDASSQSTYGVIQGAPIYWPHVDDQDLLDTMTQAELDRVGGPKITYDVGLIDLFQAEGSSYSHLQHLIEPGTRVNLLNDDPAIDIDTTILAVEWVLDDPLDVKIEQSNEDNANDPTNARKKDPLDVIVDLVARMNEQSNDTGIIADLLHQIAGGTFETPGANALLSPAAITYWNLTNDTGNFTNIFVDIIENNTNAVTQADVEDAIATAIANVIAAAGAEPHDSDVYNTYITNASSVGWVTASTFVGLPNASTVEDTTFARVTAGDDIGKIYKVNANKNGWEIVGGWVA